MVTPKRKVADFTAESTAGTFKLNMYGHKVRGIKRSTFLIDSEDKLAREWRGVNVARHAAEVLDVLRTTVA